MVHARRNLAWTAGHRCTATFGSKFVILEVVDIVFGTHVELGKLLEVVLIVVVMLVAKALTERVFDALGDEPRRGR